MLIRTYFSVKDSGQLIVLDPLMHSNNVAESSFAFGEIQKYLVEVTKKVVHAIESNDANKAIELLS
jgi:hypothetical protein